MTESTIIQIKNAINHLSNISSMLPPSTSTNLLKSYYLIKCRKLTVNGPVGLSQQFSKTTKRCPRCCVQYDQGPSSYKIKPERRKNRFVRRLLKKNGNEESLTRFQRMYLKNIMKKGNINAHNKLVITCGTCKHETPEKLNKPKDYLKLQTLDMSENTRMTKKKKKKRDRFSGLNRDVVLSLTPQNKPSNSSSITSLPSTPVIKKAQSEKMQKNLFSPQKEPIISNDNRKRKKKHQINSHKVLLEAKKTKKLQSGLINILGNSEKKQSPSVSLKQFLTSL